MAQDSKILADMQKEIDNYHEQIIFAQGDKKYDLLREIFSYYKHASAALNDTGAYFLKLPFISHQIESIIKFMPNESIINIKPYNFNDEKWLERTMDINQILDALVYQERCRLFAHAKNLGYQSFEDYDAYCDCQESSLSIYKMARTMGLDAKIKIIEPGYLYNSPLYDGGCKHIVVVINYKAKAYLVDATYKQFFMQKRCLLEKLGTPYLSSPNPGTFMVMNGSRKNTAQDLLDNGWIELTKENMKNYFDGFTLFYRNGLYYEKTGDFSYETPYNISDYYNFLSELDNQVLHEGYENIGYQKRSLKNPNMSFTKR